MSEKRRGSSGHRPVRGRLQAARVVRLSDYRPPAPMLVLRQDQRVGPSDEVRQRVEDEMTQRRLHWGEWPVKA